MICTKCRKTVKVVTKFLDEQLTNSLEIAHSITNEVAKVIDNPLFQLLVSQLPAGSNTDKVLSVIEKVLQTTGEVIKCDKLTGVEKVNCLMQGLNVLPKSERNSILARLKSALTAMVDGNRFQPYVYDTAGQLDYFNEKVKAGTPIESDSSYTEVVKEANEIAETTQTVNAETTQTVNAETTQTVNAETTQTDFGHAMPLSSIPSATPPTPNAF